MQENKKLKKTYIAGVLNLVNVFLVIALIVAYAIVLYSDVLGKNLSSSQTWGFVVVLVVILPISLFLLIPIVVDMVYKLIFSIILLKAVKKINASEPCGVNKGFFVASSVLKIISSIVFAIQTALLVAVISSGGLAFLAIIFAVILALIIAFQIVIIIIERASRKEIASSFILACD